MQLSEHFHLREFTRSRTARIHGIDNTPNSVQLSNLITFCRNCLEPLREAVGRPIIVTSGFRSPALNIALPGSSPKSAHMKGLAADIITVGWTVEELFKFIYMLNLVNNTFTYDQCIQEFDEWVHLSYDLSDNRTQALRSEIVNEKVEYSTI